MKSLQKTIAFVLASTLLAACTGGEPPPTAFPGLTVDGPSAYLASNLHVYKFELATGTEAWRFPAANAVATAQAPQPGPFAGQPVKVGNVVVVGSSSLNLYGIGDADGLEKWRFTRARLDFSDGVVTDGKLIYAPNGDGYLYALDPNTSERGEPKVVWSFKTENKLWGKPLLANGVLYQPSLDHRLYALDAATGKPVWAQPFRAGASIASTPVMQNDVLYLGAFDSKFYAINAKDGSVKWTTSVEKWVWCEALLAGDTLYFGNVGGKVFALNAANGATKWTADVGDTIRARPVLQGNRLYIVSMNTYVYEIDTASVPMGGTADVSKPMNDTIGRRLLSTPHIANGLLYIPLFDGDEKMVTISLENRERKSLFPAPTAAPGK